MVLNDLDFIYKQKAHFLKCPGTTCIDPIECPVISVASKDTTDGLVRGSLVKKKKKSNETAETMLTLISVASMLIMFAAVNHFPSTSPRK